MAFLAPHFDADVFVSYSHGDPRDGGGGLLKEWTHRLIDQLEASIRNYEDDDIRDALIWRDRMIDPTAQLTDALKGKVAAAGVLMIVMSKRYLGSSWCKDELDWFRETVKQRAGEPERVFVVRAQETEHARWPEFLRDERGHVPLGFAFFDPKAPTFPLGSEDLHNPGADYVKALRTLQTTLIGRLRELRERAERRAAAAVAPLAPAPRPAGGQRRVYLHARPEAEPLRLDIQQALAGEGVVPVTAAMTPGAKFGEQDAEAKRFRDMARRCDALLLLRAPDSDRFEDDFWDIGVDECECINALRGAPLPCAVLDKTGRDLPLDVSPWGIARFDVNRESWRHDFRSWLDQSRAAP